LSRIEEPAVSQTRGTPRWVSLTLVLGAAIVLAWAWFIFGFLSEPSAVGRVRLLLVTWDGFSALAGVLGIVAAVSGIRAMSWSRTASWLAGAALTLTVVGAIAGVPALLGVVWSRNPPPN